LLLPLPGILPLIALKPVNDYLEAYAQKNGNGIGGISSWAIHKSGHPLADTDDERDEERQPLNSGKKKRIPAKPAGKAKPVDKPKSSKKKEKNSRIDKTI
jgi:hypothetical protein